MVRLRTSILGSWRSPIDEITMWCLNLHFWFWCSSQPCLMTSEGNWTSIIFTVSSSSACETSRKSFSGRIWLGSGIYWGTIGEIPWSYLTHNIYINTYIYIYIYYIYIYTVYIYILIWLYRSIYICICDYILYMSSSIFALWLYDQWMFNINVNELQDSHMHRQRLWVF